jgi:hypothetical protein
MPVCHSTDVLQRCRVVALDGRLLGRDVPVRRVLARLGRVGPRNVEDRFVPLFDGAQDGPGACGTGYPRIEWSVIWSYPMSARSSSGRPVISLASS